MQCPQCNTALATVTHHGVEIDTCPVCYGIWFDKHEVLGYMHRVTQDPAFHNSLKKGE